MITIPLAPFYVWMLVFIRALFIFTFFPIFGESWTPVRVRILFSMALALVVAPVAPIDGGMFPGTFSGLVGLVGGEALLGFAISLVGRILFGIVQFSGQIMGEQIGFGLINAINPTGSHQVAIVAELFYVASIMIFFCAGLHHVLIDVFANSFRLVSPGGAVVTPSVSEYMVGLGSMMFEFSLRLAMPIIVAVFAINVALGVIARGVPQINVFLESFPIRIILGLIILILSMRYTVSLWEQFFGNMGKILARIVSEMGS